MKSPEQTFGYKVGLVVGTIIQLPRYIFLIVTFPFRYLWAYYQGAKYGAKLARFILETLRQRKDRN